MRLPLPRKFAALLWLAAFLAGCGLALPIPHLPLAQPTGTPTPAATPLIGANVPIPTAAVQPSPTEQSTSTAAATASPPLETTLPPTATLLPSPTPTCGDGWCAYDGHFLLSRPIAGKYGLGVDPTYRYASTNGGLRTAHTGVEFQAPEGEPVHAAGDGEVVQAGPVTGGRFASLGGDYGNLVIIQHAFAGWPQPVYSLYGHLSEVDVTSGQTVRDGQVIGRVGDTGAATGPHLHFEVRVGAEPVPGPRNPELWLKPAVPPGGIQGGAVAGRVVDPGGSPLLSQSVVLQQVGAGQPSPQTFYLQTYDTADLPIDDQQLENFAAGDLPPGEYRVSVLADGRMNIRQVTIFPGRLTVVNFDFSQNPTPTNGE